MLDDCPPRTRGRLTESLFVQVEMLDDLCDVRKAECVTPPVRIPQQFSPGNCHVATTASAQYFIGMAGGPIWSDHWKTIVGN